MMTDPTPTLRLWFMDWYGWMLDHDPLTDTATRTPFQPGRFPGLYAVVPVPLKLPCHPFMEKRISMPRPFPELEMQELSHNRVTFFAPQTKTYMRSVPIPRPYVDYTASSPAGWETFFPLTADMLQGLSLLMTPGALKLENEDVCLPFPSFEEGTNLQFGTRSLPLFLNPAALKQIGQLPPGSSTPVSLTWQIDTPPIPFVVHRQAEPNPATV